LFLINHLEGVGDGGGGCGVGRGSGRGGNGGGLCGIPGRCGIGAGFFLFITCIIYTNIVSNVYLIFFY